MTLQPRLLLGSIALAVLTACSTATAPPAQAPAATAPTATSATSATQAAAAAYDWDMDVFHPVVARNGMVASEQELASQIGLNVLKSGGNAVDAAVAMGFALAVALPNAGNLGGGGFMMVHDAKTGKDVAVDFREIAPIRATSSTSPSCGIPIRSRTASRAASPAANSQSRRRACPVGERKYA